MRSERVAVRGELERARTEYRHGRAFMAGAAIPLRWYGIASAGGTADGQRADAGGRRAHGVGALVVPHIGRVAPSAVGQALDQAGLDAPAMRERLPQLRARRDIPFV